MFLISSLILFTIVFLSHHHFATFFHCIDLIQILYLTLQSKFLRLRFVLQRRKSTHPLIHLILVILFLPCKLLNQLLLLCCRCLRFDQVMFNQTNNISRSLQLNILLVPLIINFVELVDRVGQLVRAGVVVILKLG